MLPPIKAGFLGGIWSVITADVAPFKLDTTSSHVRDSGIHHFFAVVIHEIEHLNLKCDIWSFTHPDDPDIGPGYSPQYDMDNDDYKDIWEEKGDTDGIMFSSMEGADKYEGYEPDNLRNRDASAGTLYEEFRCRRVAEEELNRHRDKLTKYDWSFDPSNEYQGKNW